MPKRKKPTVKRTVMWAVLITIIGTIAFTILLSQRQTPPLDRPVAIRYVLVDTCRQMARIVYSDLSPELITNACYQEAIDLYDAHTEAVTTCYDTVDRTSIFEWGACLTDREADFSGVYLEAAR